MPGLRSVVALPLVAAVALRLRLDEAGNAGAWIRRWILKPSRRIIPNHAWFSTGEDSMPDD
jgi:hypothetical protein